MAADAHFAAADLALTLFDQANPRAGVRAAIVCEGPEPLVSRLEALAGVLDEESTRSLPDGIYYVDQPLGDSGELTMLFPGQGSQFPNMVRDLAIDFAECRDAFSRADEVLGDAFEQSLSRFIFPVPAFEAEDKSRQFDALKATDVAQPALGASMLAILRLLQSLKIHPSAAAGHSYGELVALHAGGAFDEQALIRLSQSRGRAMADVAREHDGGDLGSMVAVNSDERTVRELVDRCGG